MDADMDQSFGLVGGRAGAMRRRAGVGDQDAVPIIGQKARPAQVARLVLRCERFPLRRDDGRALTTVADRLTADALPAGTL
jgi:hypothetical protein